MARYVNSLTAAEIISEHTNIPLHEVVDIMVEVPSEDVAPVRHGQWVKEKKDVLIHWHCSACRECYFLEEPNAKYCPNCGAKMEGAKND